MKKGIAKSFAIAMSAAVCLSIFQPVVFAAESSFTEDTLVETEADVLEPVAEETSAEEIELTAEEELAEEETVAEEPATEEETAAEETIAEEETAAEETFAEEETIAEETEITEESVILNEDPISVPELKNIVANDGALKITWNAVQDAEGYNVYRSDSGAGSWTKIGTVAKTSFADTTVQEGKLYDYTVTAYKGTQESSRQNPGLTGMYIVFIPFQSVENKGEHIKVIWDANKDASGYELYKRLPGGSWTMVVRTGETQYVDSTGEFGQTYEYMVRAYREISGKRVKGDYSESLFRSIVKMDTPVVKELVSRNGGIRVSWDAVSGAESYTVFRREGDGSLEKLDTVTKPVYTDDNVKAGTVYHYTVRAYAGSSKSNYQKNGKSWMYIPATTITKLENKGAKVKITWKKNSYAEGYYVYKRQPGGKWSQLTATSDLTYVDTTGKSGQTCEYLIRAYKKVDKTVVKDDYNTSAIKTIVKLSTPAIKNILSKDGGIRFSWKAIAGAEKYTVMRTDAESGKWTVLDKVAETSFHDKTVKAGIEYHYRVQATAGAYVSNCQKTGTAWMYLPSTKITSIKNDGTKVTVAWDANPYAKGYYVMRLQKGGKWMTLGSTKKTEYTDSSAASGVKYQYLIRAYNTVSGTKVKDNYDSSVVEPNLRLDMPALKSVKVSGNGLKVTWKKAAGASKYYVYRRNAGKAAWKRIATLGAVSSYTDKTVKTNAVYEYTVKAAKGKYVSSFVKNGKSGAYLAAPKLVSATADESSILVKWNAVDNATAYAVYRKLPSDSKWTLMKRTKGLKYRDSSESPNTEYVYTVKAYHKDSTNTCYGLYDKTGVRAMVEVSTVRKLAQERLAACGGTLRQAFNWSVGISYSKQPAVYKAEGYATWSFEHAAGDCLGKAATFYYMAKELGYECRLMYGYVPSASGGMIDHGWVEIVDGGTTYICDPDFEYETKRNGYFINYGMSGTWRYTDYYQLPDA